MTHALSFAVMIAIAGFALVVFLLPGIVINSLRGRYRGNPRHILRASLADWQTWAIALPISSAAIALLRFTGAFGT